MAQESDIEMRSVSEPAPLQRSHRLTPVQPMRIVGMVSYRPRDVIVEQLDYGVCNQHSPTDWSKSILYKGLPLIIKLEDMRCIFGVLDYMNPLHTTRNRRTTKYSTGLCLDYNSPDTKDFFTMLHHLEEAVRKDLNERDYHFISTIKTNSKGQSSLRVKLPVKNNHHLMFSVYINGIKQYLSVRDFKQQLYHGVIADVVISLGSFWCSGGKYGVSWHMKAIGMKEYDV